MRQWIIFDCRKTVGEHKVFGPRWLVHLLCILIGPTWDYLPASDYPYVQQPSAWANPKGSSELLKFVALVLGVWSIGLIVQLLF